MGFPVRWLKLDINVPWDDKIGLLREEKDFFRLFFFWIGCLCLAMKSSEPGRLLVTKDAPYTTRQLATVLRLEESFVERALAILSGPPYRMLQVTKSGVSVVNIDRYQELDELERRRQKTRDRVRRFREKRRSDDEPGNVTRKRYVTGISEGSEGTDRPERAKGARAKRARSEPLSPETQERWSAKNRQKLVERMREEFNGARNAKVTMSKATERRDFSVAHRYGATDVIDRQGVTVEEFREVVKEHESKRWGDGVRYGQSWASFVSKFDQILIDLRQRRKGRGAHGRKQWGFDGRAKVEGARAR